MKLKLSTILQLKKVQVEYFKLEENIEGINKFLLDADFLPIKVEGERNEGSYKGITFTLKVNHRTKNPALKAEIRVHALFDVDRKLNEEEQIKYILYNGLSIIYGIVRGMIFQACSVLPVSMRLLPTVDIANFIQLKLEELYKEQKKRDKEEVD